MFYTIPYVILLGWLSWEDISHLRIPIIGLIGLGCIGFSEAFFSAEDIWCPLFVAVSMYIGLWGLKRIAQYFTKSPPLGQGDVWLMAILASRIYPEHIPFFLLLVGILSWGWGMYWTHGKINQSFPMVPPMGVAFMVVRLF